MIDEVANALVDILIRGMRDNGGGELGGEIKLLKKNRARLKEDNSASGWARCSCWELNC